jgi:hypothetical protein
LPVTARWCGKWRARDTKAARKMFITIYDLRFKTTAQGQRFAVTDEFDPGIKRGHHCARPSILCGPTLNSRISGAVSASRHEG